MFLIGTHVVQQLVDHSMMQGHPPVRYAAAATSSAFVCGRGRAECAGDVKCKPDCEPARRRDETDRPQRVCPGCPNEIRKMDGTDAPARTGDPQIHNLVL